MLTIGEVYITTWLVWFVLANPKNKATNVYVQNFIISYHTKIFEGLLFFRVDIGSHILNLVVQDVSSWWHNRIDCDCS